MRIRGRVWPSAAVMLLAAGLAGCSTPQLAQPEPGMALPQGWQETEVAEASLDLATYWRQLDDPLLTEFVEAAVAHNLDLAQSAARLEQARGQLRGAEAQWMPQLSVNGRASQEFSDQFPDDNSYNLGADASWEIDLFGRIGSEVAASEADLAAAGYSLADLQRLVTGQVALATIQARATALQLAIARDTLAFQDENLQIARWRVQAGLVSSLDVEQARTQRAATAASIPQLEANLAATANAISTLIGEPPGRVLRLLEESVRVVPTPPALSAFEAPGEVLRRRPDVRQAEASLLASSARIKGAQAQLLPSIQLGGVIGIPTSGLGSLFEIVTGTLFGSVSQLIFDGGRTRARIDSAEAAAEGALAAWQLSILGALEDVETAAVDLEKSGQRVTIFDEALDAAGNSALLARSQYQAGLTDFRNLLTSENALLQARNAVVAAQAERASAFVRLTQALGGGWAPTDYPLPVSDRDSIMNDSSTTITTGGDARSVNMFLGVEERPRWRRWAKFWIPGIVIVLVALYFVNRGGKEGPEYISEPVTERSLDIEVTATGNLRPTNQVDVGSEVSGRIDAVLVDVNDRVARGQVMARINTDVIDDQIKQGQANLDAARAQVAQARATLDVDTAQLRRLQEVHRLSGGKVPSQTELEAAEANVARDRAGVNSASANVVASQAQLSSAMTNRDRAVIRSPVSGVVLARQVEPGQTVAASFNTPTLFVIAEDLSAMQLRVAVDEADVGQVKAGQKATFTVDAYPGRQFPATVERVALASNNTATSTQQQQGQQGTAVINYEARLAVANQAGLLRPGMTATANIATQSTGRRMLIPNGALRFDPEDLPSTGEPMFNEDFGLEREEARATIGSGSRQTVYVLKDDGELESIEVVTGQSDGRFTVVTSDKLKTGMKVVTSYKANEG